MRVIAIEEHYAHPGLQPAEALANLRKHPQLARIQDKLEDLGAGRLADMDAAGIDMQVLSTRCPAPKRCLQLKPWMWFVKPTTIWPKSLRHIRIGSRDSPRCRCAIRRLRRPNCSERWELSVFAAP